MPPAIALVVRALAWLAVPVGLICVIDDWLLRPRRQTAATTESIGDPPFVVFAYRILPILIAAAVVQIFLSEQLDFSLVMVVISAVTGLVFALDVMVLRQKRSAAAQAAGKDPRLVPEPHTVDYARSFFPMAVAVLLLRAFLFEPYRIPSDSMMPTLLDGDFIVVDKFAYGLKLPVTDTKIFSTGEPKRGDVVVFHPPMQPSEVWIKRVVGLPGDHVTVRDDRITVNGKPVPFTITKAYNDGCYVNMQLATEQLSTHTHQALLCPEPLQVSPDPLPGCKRRDSQGYICSRVSDPDATPLLEPRLFDMVVPPGEYLMMGDNRDNSDDGRFWGFVTEHELLGKATYIWFNWDLRRTGGPIWTRIGKRIP
ncbi:MAG TPA: signal peptidase I [Steroidobacteraceae bacterium]|nr:signal peptidase I [Steroidobacteraceae bacterium]